MTTKVINKWKVQMDNAMKFPLHIRLLHVMAISSNNRSVYIYIYVYIDICITE